MTPEQAAVRAALAVVRLKCDELEKRLDVAKVKSPNVGRFPRDLVAAAEAVERLAATL